MTNRGRPAKSMEPSDVSKRKRSGEKISKLRKDKGWTQHDMSALLDRSIATIRRYEQGEVDLHESVAKKLEAMTGIFWRYWTGETECTSLYTYLDERERELEDAAMAEWEEIEKDKEDFRNRLIALFSLCGYRYQRGNMGIIDFQDLLGDWDEHQIPQCEHQLNPYHAPNETYHFDDEEITALLNEMRNLIGFHWFKKVEAHKAKLAKK